MEIESRKLIDDDAYRDVLALAGIDAGDKTVQNQGIQSTNNTLHFWVIGYQQVTWIGWITYLQVEIVTVLMKDPIGFLGGKS